MSDLGSIVKSAANGLRLEGGPFNVAPGAPVHVELVSTSSAPLADSVLVGGEHPLRFAGVAARRADNETLDIDGAAWRGYLDSLPQDQRDKLATEFDPNQPTLSVGRTEMEKALADAGVADEPGTFRHDLSIPSDPSATGGVSHVDAQVTWLLKNADGEVVCKISGGSPTNEDLVHPDPRSTDALASFQIAPPIKELTAHAQAIVNTLGVDYSITAHVVLTAGGTTQTVETPGIPIVVVPILLPTVAMYFVDPHFRGRFLVHVPDDSPLTEARAVLAELNELHDIVGKLAWIADLADLLVGLDAVKVLPAYPHTSWWQGDACDDFDNCPDYKSVGFLFGIGPDDEAQSILFISAPDGGHPRLDFAEDEHVTGRRGSLVVDRTCIASIPDLHDAFGGELNREISSANLTH